MHVIPEVSTLDLANGIVLNGFSIPALSTRRMETDIELREGQSFLIAVCWTTALPRRCPAYPGCRIYPLSAHCSAVIAR